MIVYLIIDIYVERASMLRARSSGVGALGRGFSFFSSFLSDLLLPGRRALRLDIVDVLRIDAVSVVAPALSCVASDGDITVVFLSGVGDMLGKVARWGSG
jgi:hypothetical protein